jgi:rfaE bifunctional protein nucleotidyltransferase chain/domain
MTEKKVKNIPKFLCPCAVGFLQFDVASGNMEANLAAVRRGLEQLPPDQPGILVLPELWSTGFDYQRLPELASETPRVIEALQLLARRYDIYLAGSLPEEVLTEAGRTFYNTLYVTGPEGVAGFYRKQQVFAPMQEDRFFTPGDDPRPIQTEFGLVAGLVCYDLRFPDLVHQQAAMGAGLLLVSAQWPALRLEHWKTLLKARAIENQIFVAACNRCGETDGIRFAGHSMVIAPDGTVLAEAAEGEEHGWQEINPLLIEESRNRFNTVAPEPYRHYDQDKIVLLDELEKTVAQLKSVGRKIVFTNGCFDILHQGHVTYLEAARKEGDCLIVGVNSDASIRRLKGAGRPVNREASRARLLAALGCVDQVVLFSEDTPENLIVKLLPDVLVKGGDWPVDRIVGGKEVTAAGGRVLNIPLVENFSTTSLIRRIREDTSRS